MTVNFEGVSQKIKDREYPLIGSGSGRLVYDMNNGYVIKAAKNRRGIAQNEAEYKIATKDHSSIFAKIIAVSKDNMYIIMEKATRVNRISEVWDYYKVKSNRELFRLEKFSDLPVKYDLLLADLSRPINWGIVNNRPVIIDYGFTSEIRRRYYSLINF